MRRLILMAKRPLPGHVKTRLTPPLTEAGAVRVYEAFLADTFRTLERLAAGCQLEVCLDGPWTFTPATAPPPSARRTLQGSGDLGARLSRRFRSAFDDGVASVVAIGADTPDLPPDRLHAAFAALERHDAVVSPATDGGYVAVGTRGWQPALFREIPWGGPEVLAATRRAAAAHDVSLAEVPGWEDVDDVDALRRLADRVSPESATARALAALSLDAPNATVV